MAKFDLSKYDTVADRIKQFREKYPNGAILTRVVPEVSTFENVVCEAEIWFDLNDPRPVAKDVAAEWRGENYSAGANFTSWHENAATSAIGRALDAAGFSKSKDTTSRASREEMEKVNRHSQPTQKTAEKPAQKQAAAQTEQPSAVDPELAIRRENYKTFFAICKQIGHEWPDTENGKKDRLNFISLLINRNVGSFKDLSVDEWNDAIERLKATALQQEHAA